MNNTFNTYLTLSKGKVKGKPGVMRLEGIASTPALDADGEVVSPDGFDVDYFLKNGYMNWNHQTNDDPLAVVGKPVSAEVIKGNKLKIAFDLFPDSPKAKEIYALQNILEKQGMALGLSIEGQITGRKSEDKDHPDYNVITKAKLTGCAITPNPKNEETVINIIKGQNLNELSAYSEKSDDEREKAMNTSNSSALAKESLNDSIKKLTYDKKSFTKGELYERIFRDLPSLTINKGRQIITLIENIQKKENMEKLATEIEITEESIQKAYETLGLVKAENVEVIDDVVEVAADTTTEVVEEKVVVDTIEEEIEEEIEKEIEEIADDTVSTETAPVVDGEDIQKEDTNELIKSLAHIMKGETNKIGKKMDDKFNASGIILKSHQETIQELQQRISAIEEAPNLKKSVQTRNFIEKSFDNTQIPDTESAAGEQVLNVVSDKRTICDTLTKAITSEGAPNNAHAKAVLSFEQANQITPELLTLAKGLNIKLVK